MIKEKGLSPATIAPSVGGATFWAAQYIMITASIATTVSITLRMACVEKITTLIVCRTHGPLMGSLATRIEKCELIELSAACDKYQVCSSD